MEPGDEIDDQNDANSQYDRAIEDAITSATVGEDDESDTDDGLEDGDD